MNKITLTIEELEEILEFTKRTNPHHAGHLGSGRVEVEFDPDSGIGYALKASVLAELHGYPGVFTKYITNHKDW